MRVVFLGAGNLASNLASALSQRGHSIAQVYSRTMESAHTLAKMFGTRATDNLRHVLVDADLYIYALKDDVLESVIKQIPPTKGIHVHTAGSMPMRVFHGKQERYGVFYPLQTFSKQKLVSFLNIPMFVEASDPGTLKELEFIARDLSNTVYCISSEQRQRIHLAAVFACNFTNHLFAIANSLLGDVPLDVLLPLVDETVQKVHTIAPLDAQTGPARRGDELVMKKHLELLANEPKWRDLYLLLSKDIQEMNNK